MPTHVDWFHHDFVSERCKAAIEAAGLTGLQFTWLSDVGRYRAPQWFHVAATHPLGRGLDHPFLDPAKVVQPDHLKLWYTFDTWRFGKYWISKADLRNETSFGIATADALLEMFPDRDLTVKGFRQLIRKFIPASDFAYVWDYGLIPMLCCNARSREFLLQKGFLPADAFEPIWVWDDVPDGAQVLDRPSQSSIPPYPLVEPDWQAIQARLLDLRSEFLRNPKSECKTTAESVLLRLQALHQRQLAPHVISSKKVPPRIADRVNTPKIPRLWEQALTIADGLMFFSENDQGTDTDVYEAVPISEIGQRHAELQVAAKHRSPSYPAHLLYFASDACGDWLAFDMTTLTSDGDCRVVKYSHETLCRVREWPSIIQLLEESVEIEEKEQGEI